MKTILSVDFDWIMQPDIEMYNALCGVSSNLQDLHNMWDFIQHRLQRTKFSCNERQFADLMFFLSNITKNKKEHVHFILHHHQILDFIDPSEQVIIVNIDHHHDYGYAQEDGKVLEQYPTVANWVRCLHKENRLEKYIWVGNLNSDGINLVQKSLQDKFNFYTELSCIDTMHYDEIIICFSQEWIPPNIRPLYFVLKELVLKGDK